MTYKSVLKKVFNVFDKFFLKNKRISENIYFTGEIKKNTNDIKILLYFPHYEFMHFGDHLFFEPLIRKLVEVGFDTYVMPIKKMEFYFSKLGYKIGNYEEINQCDIIITKTEFIRKVKKYNKSCIYIDTAYRNIKRPLCFDISEKILKVLLIDDLNIDDKPKMYNPTYDVYKKFSLNPKERYIIYNNYIDSGSFRINNKMILKLEKFAKKIKEEQNYKIIHIGTINDKESDLKKYDFVDLDLRGKTTPEDLFGLISLNNIYAYVGFDNFLMHLFFMVGKKNYIMFRGRYFKSNEMFIKKYVNPPFVYNDNLDKLIEYI